MDGRANGKSVSLLAGVLGEKRMRDRIRPRIPVSIHLLDNSILTKARQRAFLRRHRLILHRLIWDCMLIIGNPLGYIRAGPTNNGYFNEGFIPRRFLIDDAHVQAPTGQINSVFTTHTSVTTGKAFLPPCYATHAKNNAFYTRKGKGKAREPINQDGPSPSVEPESPPKTAGVFNIRSCDSNTVEGRPKETCKSTNKPTVRLYMPDMFFPTKDYAVWSHWLRFLPFCCSKSWDSVFEDGAPSWG